MERDSVQIDIEHLFRISPQTLLSTRVHAHNAGLPSPQCFIVFGCAPQLQPFITKLSLFYGITGRRLPKMPLLLLFSYSIHGHTRQGEHCGPIPQWAHLCLLATHKSILKVWLSSSLPTITTVKKHLTKLLYREKLDTEMQNYAPTKQIPYQMAFLHQTYLFSYGK